MKPQIQPELGTDSLRYKYFQAGAYRAYTPESSTLSCSLCIQNINIT
jgi:hypothetical protein